MFALVTLGPPHGSANLERDPHLAAGQRRRHAAITASCHLSKRTGTQSHSMARYPGDELLYQADHSYESAVARPAQGPTGELNT